MKMSLRALALASALAAFAISNVRSQVNTVQEIAPGVFFHQGDMTVGHCNNGWVVFDDHVLVIDANYPGGARVIMPKIRETTRLPVRVVLDTHHHADHAYANRLWAEAGALVVAHVGVATEMREREPADWNARAPRRPDMMGTTFKPPTVLFDRDLYFDDGDRRVEMHWFGVAHTRGDGFAWLPEERILFTGDACVNGPHNFVRDANIGEWIKTLEHAKQLAPLIVCPGHGPVGGPEILADQQQFFAEIQRRVQQSRDAGKSADEVKAAVPAIDEALKAIPNIERFVGSSARDKVEKVWTELGGLPFPR